MGLHVEWFRAERRIRSDVDSGYMAFAVEPDRARVDALAGEQQSRPRLQIGRRIAKPATPTRAAHDGSVQDESSTQRDARPLEVAARERLSDRRRRDGALARLLNLDRVRTEPESLPLRRQRREGAQRLVPEREVRADDASNGMEAVPKNLGHEAFCRPPRELLGELEDDHHVDAGLLDQRRLSIDRREEPGDTVGREDLARVPVERDRDGGHAFVASGRDGCGEHRTVPQVNAVEEPYRPDRRSMCDRERGKAEDPFHAPEGSDYAGASTTSGRAFA